MCWQYYGCLLGLEKLFPMTMPYTQIMESSGCCTDCSIHKLNKLTYSHSLNPHPMSLFSFSSEKNKFSNNDELNDGKQNISFYLKVSVHIWTGKLMNCPHTFSALIQSYSTEVILYDI
jgi:hypothetical protein